MGKKKQHHEEHIDETWLIPYADMLTLLLALFIVMFAMSQLDKAKIAKASEQFNIIFSGGAGLANSGGSGSAMIESYKDPSEEAPSKGAIEEDKMNEVKEKLEQEIESKGYSDKVKVVLDKEGLEISMQDVILFNSGDADVLSQASPLLEQISKMLAGLDNNIRVTGHTDNKPISNSKFRSNWDLSAMRAINVMNFMSNVGGIPPQRLAIQAYGEYMPKYDNSTEAGRAKNRRVEISIVRKYPVENNEKKN